MLEYNLTQRERQIVIQLFELSQHTKDHFEARIVDSEGTGPSHELAQLDFGGDGQSMQLTKRDLGVLKDEGLIYFRWDLPKHGSGRLSLTFSGTADLAAKGEMIGEFGERLAAWMVALSIWTEWNAAHRVPPVS